MRQKYIDASTSFFKINFFGFLIGTIMFFIVIIIYILLWGVNSLANSLNIEGYFEGFLFTLFLIIGIFVHELLHGLGYIIGGIKKSDLVYGVNWKSMMPYISCKVPVSIKTYKLAGVLPFIILGVIPIIIALFFEGLGLLFFWALLMIMICSGDVFLFFKIRKFSASSFVVEHPKRVGCYILEDVQAEYPINCKN